MWKITHSEPLAPLTSTVIVSSDLDGLRFGADEHGKLVRAVATVVERLIG